MQHRLRSSDKKGLAVKVLAPELLERIALHCDRQTALNMGVTNREVRAALLPRALQWKQLGIDPNCAASSAAAAGRADIVEWLLTTRRKDVDPTAGHNAALLQACQKGYAAVVKLLLADERVDPAADDDLAIQTACSAGHAAVVQILLKDKRVDPAACDNVAISVASRKNCAPLMKLLLRDVRVDPTTSDNEPMATACYMGNDEVVRVLLEDGRADPVASWNKPLMLACDRGHPKVVKLLLADERVDTTHIMSLAMLAAVEHGHAAVCAELLKARPTALDILKTAVDIFRGNGPMNEPMASLIENAVHSVEQQVQPLRKKRKLNNNNN